MAYRNGIVADTLRAAGMPYKVIFGLQLPQLSQIAQRYAPNSPLAHVLWADTRCREARLLACYLFDSDAIEIEEAQQLCETVITQEEADILAFRLLRRLPFRAVLHTHLTKSDTSAAKMSAKALARFL